MALMGFPHKDELCRLHQDSGAGWTSANWAGNEGNVLRKALAKRKLEIAKVENKKAAKRCDGGRGSGSRGNATEDDAAAAAAIAGTPPNMLPHSGSGTALSALAAASQPASTLRLQ